MFDGFVNPGLALGAALAIVPLIIHLLNRQRHKPMAWAAMRFVLAAYRRTRRRAQLENLLLLLLRMGAVALLALAVARPFAGQDSPLAAITESRRDLVLVIDGSASMGYREELEDVFEKTVARAREILLELDGGRGDRTRLLYAGAYPRLLSWRSPEEALDLLDTLSEPTDEPLDLSAALGEVVRFAKEDAAGTERSGLEVRLLSDLQKNAFLPDIAAPAPHASTGGAPSSGAAALAAGDAPEATPRLVEQLEVLRGLGVRVLVEDLGSAQPVPPNLGVVAVEPLSPLIGPGIPAEIAVDVENFGSTSKGGLHVWIMVDGERRPHKQIDVPARGRTRAVFPVAFRTRGDHRLVAGIDPDRLPVDDMRAAIVTVPPAIRVLLVNGSPADELADDEVGVLSVVLQPPQGDDLSQGGHSPFTVQVEEAAALSSGDLDLGDFDVIWLANVGSLGQRAVERLEQRVAGGAALVISLGDEVQPEAYNARLFRADGSGLLPAEILAHVAVTARDTNYFRVQRFEATHPALAFFSDERWKPLLTEMPFYEFFGARPLENARVLAVLDDGDASPLLIERSYDQGRVYLFTSTIDDDWTLLPQSPRTLVPFTHELLRHAARPVEPQRNVLVGQALEAQVAQLPSQIALVLPDNSRRSITGEAQPAGQSSWRLPAVTDTPRAGLYQIEIEHASGTRDNLYFAVQLAAKEGDLERLDATALAAVHPALVLVGSAAGKGRGADEDIERQGELWRWLAGACLAFVVLETLWAAWLGHKRRLP